MIKNSTLDDLAVVVGFSATVRLAAHYGGRDIYVPSHVSEMHPIAKLIGVSALRRLCAEFDAGERIAVPTLNFAEIELRNKEILDMIRDGKTVVEIVGKTGLTKRRVEQLRKTLGNLVSENSPEKAVSENSPEKADLEKSLESSPADSVQAGGYTDIVSDGGMDPRHQQDALLWARECSGVAACAESSDIVIGSADSSAPGMRSEAVLVGASASDIARACERVRAASLSAAEAGRAFANAGERVRAASLSASEAGERVQAAGNVPATAQIEAQGVSATDRGTTVAE